jgi:uroporphyrin-III C-methyltransferase/precorrin-2 dehydrogenase/sirohydrochlorin ferrochelatase
LSSAIEQAESFARDSTGVVHLVGTGPGDADLLTLRALNAMQNADVVLYDEQVSSEILDRARRDAELVFIGKREGASGIGQNEINRLLAEAAKAGDRVVLLKGGDPAFDREFEYLHAEDITVTVVPGISHSTQHRHIEVVP